MKSMITLTHTGINTQYANAIAQTISTARQIYEEQFGFNMPDTIRANVKCGRGNSTRLFTDGQDSLFLSIPSPGKLAKPSKSGVFNIYGMCHELGHMAMYRTLKNRDWMTSPAAQGWAHYAGSLVVDRVYKNKGNSLWPDKYNYRLDGTARLKKQLEAKQPSKTAQAAGKWQELENIIGINGFAKLFAAWQTIDVDLAKPVDALLQTTIAVGQGKTPQSPKNKKENEETPKAKPKRAPSITKGPKGHSKKTEALNKWFKSAETLFVEKVVNSEFQTKRLSASKLTGRPLKIAFDDGTSEGQKSIAGGGHARKFNVPGIGEWYIRAVNVYGSRYGRAKAPKTTFDLALCDKDMKTITLWKKPYSTFKKRKRGDRKWVRIPIPPTQVPKEFYICLNFRPERTKGVYVSYDTSTKGNSMVATPGKKGSPFEQGDWMIRIELDQPKGTDALKD
ncbi:MAG: hypothetical protein ACYTF1_09300 [Planctomycetota bacterium]|jgi:hypothetical protein